MPFQTSVFNQTSVIWGLAWGLVALAVHEREGMGERTKCGSGEEPLSGAGEDLFYQAASRQVSSAQVRAHQQAVKRPLAHPNTAFGLTGRRPLVYLGQDQNHPRYFIILTLISS